MPEHDALTTLVGRMTVGELARTLGMSVGELVDDVLRGKGTKARRGAERQFGPVSAPTRGPNRVPTKAASTSKSNDPTRDELHDAVDRFVLGHVLDDEGGNLTRVAARLGVNRKRVRDRWAKVRGLAPDSLARCVARVRGARRLSPGRLRALGSLNEIHAEADRWLVGQVLAQEGGNVTLTARRLGTSRRLIRELRAKLGLE